MARVRCYRCGIETLTLNLTGVAQQPRCSNCDAPLPVLKGRFGLVGEDGEEPGIDAARAISEPDPA